MIVPLVEMTSVHFFSADFSFRLCAFSVPEDPICRNRELPKSHSCRCQRIDGWTKSVSTFSSVYRVLFYFFPNFLSLTQINRPNLSPFGLSSRVKLLFEHVRRFIGSTYVLIVMASDHRTNEHTPLLPKDERKSLWKNLRLYLNHDVHRDWADLPLIFLYFSTGLIDSSSISTWGSFVSMQTGMRTATSLITRESDLTTSYRKHGVPGSRYRGSRGI